MHFDPAAALPFAAIGAALLAASLAYMALLPEAGRAFRWWAGAYSATAARWALLSPGVADGWTVAAYMAQGLQLLAALLLLGGALVFVGRRLTLGSVAGAVAVAAAWPAIAAMIWGAPGPMWPLYLAGGLVHIATGAVYVGERRQAPGLSDGYVLVGALFGALGLMKVALGVLDQPTQAAAASMLATHATHLLLAVGLIITAQRQQQMRADAARRQLRRSEERFRDFADIASDWYWEMDAALRFTYFSERMEQATGLRMADVLGRRRDEIDGIAAEDSHLRDHVDILRGHKPFRDFRYRYIDSHGNTRWIAVSGRPMHDDRGVFVGYRGVGRDVTMETRARMDIDEARKAAELASRSKSEFLANISHELRTPLNAIIGFSEIIRDRQFGSKAIDRYADYAADIHASGTHLLDVINDVLDMAKIEAGRYQLHDEPLELAPLVDSCRRIIDGRAREKEIDLVLALPQQPPRVMADKRAMKQILINLLSNAVKFTHAGGRITVAARLDPVDGGTGLRLSVTDTGIGIAESDLAHIMEPFRQADTRMSRSFEGTGLGLTIVKNLIEMHDGRLDLDSTVGRGTTVTFTLPPSRVIDADLGGDDYGTVLPLSLAQLSTGADPTDAGPQDASGEAPDAPGRDDRPALAAGTSGAD
jgi:PAS domain S-box-containing protein